MPPISFLYHLRNTFQAITRPREKLNKGLVVYNEPTPTAPPSPPPPAPPQKPPAPAAAAEERPVIAESATYTRKECAASERQGSVVESLDDRTEMSSCISTTPSTPRREQSQFVDPFDQALAEAEQMLRPEVPRLNIPMSLDNNPLRTWSASSFGSDCSTVSSVSSLMGLMGKSAKDGEQPSISRRKSLLPQLVAEPNKRWKGHGRGIGRNNHQSFIMDNVVMDAKPEDNTPLEDPDDIGRDDDSVDSCSTLGSARGAPNSARGAPNSARGCKPNTVSCQRQSPEASSSRLASPNASRAKSRLHPMLPSLGKSAGRRVSVSVRR
eukprot:GGOE01024989.1.p1 GENE.GGOE01024989.1~~GGOE01024989.1.p1  ORF type:complete len:324 (-),score=47.53 GGOE01024989.1:570-1541(-)